MGGRVMTPEECQAVPKHVMNAFGTLVLYGLGQNFDHDNGWFLESHKMSVGPSDAVTELGAWRVEIRRLPTPAKES